MNLRVRRFGPIIGLALFIFACEDPGEIGLELNPEKGDMETRYVELPVTTSVVQLENVNTLNYGSLLVGDLSDPNFGNLEAVSYSRIMPITSSLFDPKDSTNVFDSIVIALNLDYVYGRNFDGVKSFEIHELSDEILSDQTYNTKDQSSYFPDLLGEFSYDFTGTDTISIDTTVTVRLDDAFGLKLFNEATDTTKTSFDNPQNFIDYFHGLAFVPSTGSDVIIGFRPENTESRIHLYYHNNEDTTKLDFSFYGTYQNTDTTIVNLTRYYYHLSQDKTGTPIDVVTNYNQEFETGNDFTYVQAGTGVLTKIDFGSLQGLLDSVSNIVLNRAELTMEVEPYDNYIQPPANLYLTVTDESNDFIYDTTSTTGAVSIRRLYDAFSSSSTSIKYYTLGFEKDNSENKGYYQSVITAHIMSIIEGTGESKPLFLTPTSFNYSAENFVSRKNSIKLKIYYSTVR